MADDFDNTDEIENLSDDELGEYVRTSYVSSRCWTGIRSG